MKRSRTFTSPISDGWVALFVSFAGIGLATRTSPTVALGETAIALCMGMWGEAKSSQTRQFRIVLLLCTLTLAALWMVQFGSWAAVLGGTGWSTYLIRRIRATTLVHEEDVQTSRLMVDLVLFSGTWLLVEWIGPETVEKAQILWTLLILGLFGATSRVFAMYTIQRQRAGETPSLRTQSVGWLFLGLFGLVSVALIAGMIFPKARNLLLIFMAFALALALMIRIWREVVVNVVVFVGLVLLVAAVVRLSHPKTQGSRVHGQIPKPLVPVPHAGIHSFALPPIDWAFVFVVILLLVTVWLVLRARRFKLDTVPSGPDFVVERTRLPRRRKSPQVVAPTPLRRLVAAWLRWEMRHGHAMEPGETLQTYGLRLKEERGKTSPEAEETAGGGQLLTELIANYERERYGLRSTPSQVVDHLDSKLHETISPRKKHSQ